MSENPEFQEAQEGGEQPMKTKKTARKVTRVSKILTEKKVSSDPVHDEPAGNENVAIEPEAATPAEASAIHDVEETSKDEEWAQKEAESVGGEPTPGESSKRKRRRRRGKGGSQVEPTEAVPKPAPQIRVDPEMLGKAAWKIYLAEVSEEGVALIGDQDARELAKRCFRLAEIFLEEQRRRTGAP